ncbi:MAG: hypothetical protein ACREBE_27735, partial [bacterium]
MRVLRFVTAASLCAGLALTAGHARAASEAISGSWEVIDEKESGNFCELFFENDGDTIVGVDGSVTGTGTGGDTDTIFYFTPEVTNASRNSKSATVKQSSFSELDFRINGTSVSGGFQSIEKCSINQSVNPGKGKGNAKVSCKGDNLNSILDANEVASFQTAFASS